MYGNRRGRASLAAAVALLLLSGANRPAAAKSLGLVNCDINVDVVIRELFDGDGDAAVNTPGGEIATCAAVDVNGDGRVTVADLVAVAAGIHFERTATRTPTLDRSPTPTFTSLAVTPIDTPGAPTRTRPPTPTPTEIGRPTPTPGGGAEVSFFGLDVDGDGIPESATSADPNGVPIFETAGLVSDFTIIVEGIPGKSGKDPGDVTLAYDPDDPSLRPDLQIEADRPLGTGNEEVCDGLGSVPAITPPSFAVTPMISAALNDFACNFDVAVDEGDACTVDPDTEDAAFVNPDSAIQFCYTVMPSGFFLPGSTRLLVRLRDIAGGAGHTAALIVKTGP